MHPRRGQLSPLRVPEDCPAEVAALQVLGEGMECHIPVVAHACRQLIQRS